VVGTFWHTAVMVRLLGLGFCCRFAVRGVGLLLCVLGPVMVGSGGVVAAQNPPVQQDGSVPTLHVYANLVQVPTLVLGPYRDRIKKPLAENRFSVSIDDGPWFPATHVRQEGDDPISLAILLDVSGGTAALMPKISEAIAGLAPLSLHPKDHVSIYALDCQLIRSLNDIPAESAHLKEGTDRALKAWMIRQQNKHAPGCRQSDHLWDVLTYITHELYDLPGRRVIFAVADGYDKGSARSSDDVRVYAQRAGVTIFGVTYVDPYVLRPHALLKADSGFNSICESSGGLVLSTDTGTLHETLKQGVTMVRERYIVEFPRPFNSTEGQHGIQVRIAKSADAFIRAAGVSMPIPDPAVLADPTTVHSDPSRAPEQGNRNPIKKPQ
jgi:hypothetical protein